MTPKAVAPIIKKVANSSLFRYTASKHELMKAANKAAGIDCYDFEVENDKFPQLFRHLDTAIQLEMKTWPAYEGPTVDQYVRIKIITRLLRTLDRVRMRLSKS